MPYSPNLTRAAPYRRCRPVRDVAFRRRWMSERRFCSACGCPDGAAPWPGMSCHHVLKFGRSDEATNLLKTCIICHDLCELKTVRRNGRVLETLPLGAQLTLKYARDPDETDFSRLAELHGGSLPDLLPLPPWVETAWAQWRGRDAHTEYLLALRRLAHLLGEDL